MAVHLHLVDGPEFLLQALRAEVGKSETRIELEPQEPISNADAFGVPENTGDSGAQAGRFEEGE
jgi:hypothetical protein